MYNKDTYINEVRMFKALLLAKNACTKKEVPVGAVIVCGDKIISCGENMRELSNNALYHAEISAIYKACNRLKRWRLFDCDLYVTLEPCPMCAGAVINSRIQRVFFGAYDKKAGACTSVVDLFSYGFNHTPIIVGGLLKEECAKELSEFFRLLRQKQKNQNKKL